MEAALNCACLRASAFLCGLHFDSRHLSSLQAIQQNELSVGWNCSTGKLQQNQDSSGNQRLPVSVYSHSAIAQLFIKVIVAGFNMNLTKKILTGVLAFICVLGLGSPVYAGGKNGGNSNHAASSGHAAKGGGSKGDSRGGGSKGDGRGEGSKGGSGKEGSKGGKSGARGSSKDGRGKDNSGEGSGDALDTANKIIDLINGFKH